MILFILQRVQDISMLPRFKKDPIKKEFYEYDT